MSSLLIRSFNSKLKGKYMKKIAIVALLSVFAAAPAVAADMYVGVKAGSVSNKVNTSESSNSFGISGGYTINPNFAVEVGYTDLGDVASGVIKFSALEISAVGSYPINEQFSLFGKLGMANTTEKLSALSLEGKRTAATYGLGGQYNVSPTIGVRLGWEHYGFGDGTTFNEGDSSLVSLGGVFKF
jgi:OOP family OmpA-OmpF porin